MIECHQLERLGYTVYPLFSHNCFFFFTIFELKKFDKEIAYYYFTGVNDKMCYVLHKQITN